MWACMSSARMQRYFSHLLCTVASEVTLHKQLSVCPSEVVYAQQLQAGCKHRQLCCVLPDFMHSHMNLAPTRRLQWILGLKTRCQSIWSAKSSGHWTHTSSLEACYVFFCLFYGGVDSCHRCPLGLIVSLHESPEWLCGVENVARPPMT